MEFKILNDKENKLFNRRELHIHAIYDGKTPTRSEIREAVCKKLNLSPETFDIISIDQKYGIRASDIVAHSYSDKKSMARFAKEKSAAEQPAPAKEEKQEEPAKKEAKEEKKE